MGTYITEDFIVEDGEVRSYAMNSDNYRSSAFIVGDYDGYVGQVPFEPSIYNYGELHLLAGEPGAGSFFHYGGSMPWTTGVFENHGSITIDLPELGWARLITATDRAPDTSNYGTVYVRGGSDAAVVRAASINFSNDSTGVLEVEADVGALAFWALNGASLTNHGTITTHTFGDGRFPESEHSIVIHSGGSINLDNSGLIQATADASYISTHVVWFYDTGSLTLTNSGMIIGDYAIYQQESGNLYAGYSTIVNSGIIDGHMRFVKGENSIANSGQIIGNIEFGIGNDRYDGTGGILDGILDGGAGNDMLSGGTRSDTIYGGDGADEIDGQSGSDTLFGGTGNDLLVGGTGWDTIYGDGWSDRLFGNNGNDRLFGGYGNDVLDGGGHHDFLDGGAGNDALIGGVGNDFLNGGGHHDVLDGGLGDDVLMGNWGQDTLTGGAGADRFLFKAGHSGRWEGNADFITDFSQTDGDVIDLSAIDAIAGSGNDAFTFIGDAAFSGTAGELMFYKKDGDTFVAGDVNGDGVADFLIKLTGEIDLTANDFML